MLDYRKPEIVKARAKAYALLLQWAKEAEQKETTLEANRGPVRGKPKSNSQGNSAGN